METRLKVAVNALQAFKTVSQDQVGVCLQTCQTADTSLDFGCSFFIIKRTNSSSIKRRAIPSTLMRAFIKSLISWG